MAIATPDTLFSPVPMFGTWADETHNLLYGMTLPAEGVLDVDRLLFELHRDRAKGGRAHGVETLDLLKLEVADIGLTISAPITRLDYDHLAGTVDVVGTIERSAEVLIKLTGEVVPETAYFNPREIFLRIAPRSNLAKDEFVASILTAALALGGVASVGMFGGDVKFRGFELPLAQIADELRSGQTALRLMIIGTATGASFEFPAHLSGTELQEIAFLRRAIIDRRFVWPIARHPLTLHADPETLHQLETTREPTRIAIPRPTVVDLQGRQVSLGSVRVVMEGGVIEDLDRIISEVSRLDGHPVTAYVRSVEGRATVECPEAPTLPANPWDPATEGLISLEQRLCALLTKRYNALAAGTLAGLSDEEKEELTNPSPSIGELLLPQEDEQDS
jgi:hypothetical protein